jgi:heme exporter protein D
MENLTDYSFYVTLAYVVSGLISFVYIAKILINFFTLRKILNNVQKKIIKDARVILEGPPTNMMLTYDPSCNLSCLLTASTKNRL